VLKDKKITSILRGLWSHLNSRRKRDFFLLFVLIVISSLAEIFSLGAVLPFIGVLSDPDRAMQNSLVQEFAKFLGVSAPSKLVLPLTIVFIFAALMAGGCRLILLRASNKLAYSTGSDISVEVFRRTLYQPYEVHVARNSSEVISGITQKVGNATGVLVSILSSASSAVLLVAIMATLLAIDAVVAIVATLGFGLSYVAVTFFARRRLELNGQRISHEHTQVIKVLQEGLGGIRDVILDGTQSSYSHLFGKADAALRQAQGSNSFINQWPRYAIEALGVALIASLAYSLSLGEGGVNVALPTLGALALGAQRLLPVLQQLYGNWSNITGSRATLVSVLELLDQPLPLCVGLPSNTRMAFNRSIIFEHVSFRYKDSDPWVLSDINIEIAKGSRIGFVGSTGSGKSTLLDLLMLLLAPSQGGIYVDKQRVNDEEGRRAWQRNIAHVPQNIYLADTTLAENIAFGVAYKDIDMERVRAAARQAQIDQFIESRPKGYLSLAGERGIRLSGGERQRIGIARALYKHATVLVFDEATSALDNTTEQALIGAIENLDRELTILMIAHRLTTVQRCNHIIELANGRVVAEGTFDQLREQSVSFRHMLLGSNR
jgi:ABC-type multidrug transport system fused ATPase/permease subunit